MRARPLRSAALALGLALALLAPAPQAPRARADGAPDPAAAVGVPPAPGSDEARADLAILLWEQERRTEEDVRRAASEVRLTLEAFAGVLGVEAARLPRTQALLDLAHRDAKAVADPIKQRHQRPRPFAVDDRIQPAIPREESFSFPSGHATRGAFFGRLLGEVVPERREALRRRGEEVGRGRVTGGVHWPSDVRAGQRLGAALFEERVRSEPYQAAIAAARAEWAAVSGGAPAR